MTTQMNWKQLLSAARLGKGNHEDYDNRTAFQKDVDRIIFSSAFRRLQDKTQVFPLAKNDYVRTRLTHSLEVSSVGRSLGDKVGEHLLKNNDLGQMNSRDIGSIIAAACLAHDLGNPPFGHFGEEAIRSFFVKNPVGVEITNQVSESERLDLKNFEGNAQGFRILSKLQNPDVKGGMQLTYATLGAFVKYPCTAGFMNENRLATKKNGILQDDLDLFLQVVGHLGLIQTDSAAWARHPLVYLMEAADDICYAIIDIEDAYQIKQVSYEQAFGLLSPLAGGYDQQSFNQIKSLSDRLSYLRAKAIGCLVQEATDTFVENEVFILKGEFDGAISDRIQSAEKLADLTKFASKNIYNCSIVVETEMAGFKILESLMEMFCSAVNDVYLKKKSASAYSQMLIHLLPTRFIGENRELSDSTYIRVIKVCDFISGMTDSYAVGLYKKLTGIHI